MWSCAVPVPCLQLSRTHKLSNFFSHLIWSDFSLSEQNEGKRCYYFNRIIHNWLWESCDKKHVAFAQLSIASRSLHCVFFPPNRKKKRCGRGDASEARAFCKVQPPNSVWRRSFNASLTFSNLSLPLWNSYLPRKNCMSNADLKKKNEGVY